MTHYYYVGVSLPPLSFDQAPEMRFNQLQELLRENLTAKDLEKEQQLLRLYDILNIRSLWLKQPLDPMGGLDEYEIEEALLNQKGLPDYVYEFLEKHPQIADRLHNFPWLLVRFFAEAEQETSGFVYNYLKFEREWRLVFTGFRIKKLGWDLNVELQYENPEEELIGQLLAQKDAKQYEPPEKYEILKNLFQKFGDDPLALEKAIDEYRFNFIQDLVANKDPFSIDPILAYTMQLIIIEKWDELDKNQGIKIVDTLV